jgi:hypothetical protein
MWLTCYNNISDGRRVSQTNYDFIRFLVNAWLSGYRSFKLTLNPVSLRQYRKGTNDV